MNTARFIDQYHYMQNNLVLHTGEESNNLSVSSIKWLSSKILAGETHYLQICQIMKT